VSLAAVPCWDEALLAPARERRAFGCWCGLPWVAREQAVERIEVPLLASASMAYRTGQLRSELLCERGHRTREW
jgi:hypothetical protein